MELKFNIGFEDLLAILKQLPFDEKVRVKKAIDKDLNSNQANKPKRKAGTMKGLVRYMAPDFDAPCEDFKDYM